MSSLIFRDNRESGIVTKVFIVEYVPPEMDSSDEDNDENFLKEIAKKVQHRNLIICCL